MSYHKTSLNFRLIVDVDGSAAEKQMAKATAICEKVVGITKVTQIFPEDAGLMASLFILTVDEDKLDAVQDELSKVEGVSHCEKIPVRKTVETVVVS